MWALVMQSRCPTKVSLGWGSSGICTCVSMYTGWIWRWSRCSGRRSIARTRLAGPHLNGLAALLQIGSIASLCVVHDWMPPPQDSKDSGSQTNAAICAQDSLTFSDSIPQSAAEFRAANSQHKIHLKLKIFFEVLENY